MNSTTSTTGHAYSPAPRTVEGSPYGVESGSKSTGNNKTGEQKQPANKPILSSSFYFNLFTGLLSIIFWILGWIPVVNWISDPIYWWLLLPLIYLIRYTRGAIDSAKNFISSVKNVTKKAPMAVLKVGIIATLAFVLTAIPVISLIPWDVIATAWINRILEKSFGLST